MKLNGFIDLHTHGIGKFDTRTSRPDRILKIAEIHGRAGTGAILPAIYSGSIKVMRENIEAVKKAMKMQQSPGIGGQAAGRGLSADLYGRSRILGVHLEGPFLNPARQGALDRHSFIKPSVSSLKELIAGYEDIIRIMTIAPELPGALQVIEACVHRGIRASMGHSDATLSEAADGKKAGASAVTHIFNAMRPFHHREPGLAGFGLLDEDVYIEVIADGAHLHPETLRLVFSLKRYDRVIIVSDSVKGPRTGSPVFNSRGTLAGSGVTLSDSVAVLKGINLSDKEILYAGIHNPRRLLTKK
jgi:N-acetylglucosamine-6-phosphate deacetylase